MSEEKLIQIGGLEKRTGIPKSTIINYINRGLASTRK
jgi:hypothetical protein